MTKLLLIPVLLFINIQTTECLSCYMCNNVTEDSVCTRNITQCALGQSCFKSTRLVNNTDVISLGCLDNSQCSSMTGVSNIVGRDVYRRHNHNCMECCSADICNLQLCNHQKPTVCIDDASVDCAKLNSIFSICSDVQHAKNVCPRFCGLCNVVDGEWSKWSEWSQCDVTCSNGTETRTRSCTNPRPEHGGLDCVGDKQEVRSCYTATECPVNGEWSKWSEWSQCDVTCNNGTETRTRSCTNPRPEHGGLDCVGDTQEVRSCFTAIVCPVPGGWSYWNHWGSCSTSCDTGIQRRTRNCTNPKPAYSGDHCFGQNMDDRLCSNGPCADGGWSTWSSWSKCSTTCGVGIRSQSRACSNPVPSLNGHDCIGVPIRVDTCNINKKCDSDCSEIKLYNTQAQDGIYDVTLWRSNRTIQVYCDMTTDGGGWTVFQNRYHGSVDFYRNYNQYVHGFGDLHTEFWLGLDFIQEMTSQTLNELRIDLMAANGTTAYEVFSSFSLSPPAYVLNVGNTTSSKNIGSRYRFGPFHNGSAFSAYDHDVDSSSLNCASFYHGAWWYNNCLNANLNGQYLTPGTNYGIGISYDSFIISQSMKRSKMAFRRERT